MFLKELEVYKDSNMKFIERQYARYEKRYCEKHGRKKFLERTKDYYGRSLRCVIVDSILVAICSILGIGELIIRVDYSKFPDYIWFFSFAFLSMTQVIFWSIRLPFDKKKSLECKNELETYNVQELCE